jgi:CubicO group peptidase (beta-lactamase class C family)
MSHGVVTWFALVLLVAASGLPAGDENDFPRDEPAAVGIDTAALERLRKRAEETDSDALVVIKDGKLVVEWTFGKPEGPIEAMSATKSVVSLAVGRLIDDGKIASLDQPVHEFYPEWRPGRKRRITIRHLLNHTSGVHVDPSSTEFSDSGDGVKLALAAEISDDPGTKFVYNNKAVNLLAGIVEKAAGMPLDRYVGETIFKPMGITEFSWLHDGAGNPQGMAGLQIRARDFAKVGQMMLDKGVWRGRRIVSERWVELSTTAAQSLEPTCGLLWWLALGDLLTVDDAYIEAIKAYGATDATLEALRTVKGRPLEPMQFAAEVGGTLRKDAAIRPKLDEIQQLNRQGKGPMPKRTPGRPIAFYAAGYLGQVLVVYPQARLVAVRQFRSPGDANRQRNVDPKTIDEFHHFLSLVRVLVPPARTPPKP